jgi:hypothetical protein
MWPFPSLPSNLFALLDKEPNRLSLEVSYKPITKKQTHTQRSPLLNRQLEVSRTANGFLIGEKETEKTNYNRPLSSTNKSIK